MNVSIDRPSAPVSMALRNGRTVRSFLSAIDTGADGLSMETFMLYPEGQDGPSRGEAPEHRVEVPLPEPFRCAVHEGPASAVVEAHGELDLATIGQVDE